MNNNLIRMEKKSTNVIGIIIFLIFIIGFSVGGYFLYKNKENLSFFPWSDKSNDKENGSSNGNSNVQIAGLSAPAISGETNLLGSNGIYGFLKATKIKASDKGFEITLSLQTSNEESDTKSVEIICNKVLIDGYETTTVFKIQAYANQGEATTTIIIPRAELENLETKSFHNLTFFIEYINHKDDSEPYILNMETILQVYPTELVSNEKTAINTSNAINKLKIYYYQKIEASDGTYLYFISENGNKEHNFKIQLKKLIINNEVYEKAAVSFESHYNSKKMFYIKIPKEAYEDIKRVNIAFAITKDLENYNSIYFTNDMILDLTK